MDVKIRLKVQTKLNSTKICREYWSVLYYYRACISIQGYFCNLSLKFKLPYSAILVILCYRPNGNYSQRTGQRPSSYFHYIVPSVIQPRPCPG